MVICVKTAFSPHKKGCQKRMRKHFSGEPSVNKLKESALSKAREFAQQPRRSLSGRKRLLNYSLSDLKGYLNFENEILLRIVIKS